MAFVPILAGMLGGIGGIGQAVEQARKDRLDQLRLDQQAALERERIAESKRQFDVQQQAREAERWADPSSIASIYQAIGLTPPTERMLTSLVAPSVTAAIEQRKARQEETDRLREEARLREVQGLLRGAGGAAPAPQPVEAEMYSDRGVMPGRAPATPNELVAALAGIKGGPELAKLLMPPEGKNPWRMGGTAESGLYMYHEGTGETRSITDPVTKDPRVTTATVNTQEGVFRETYDAQGNVIRRERVGSPVQQPREPAQPSASNLATGLALELQQRIDRGETDASPRVRELKAQLNALKLLAVQPGGSAFGAGDIVTIAPPGGAPTTAPSGGGAPGGPTPRVTVPGVPAPTERKHLTDLETGIDSMTRLIDGVEKYGSVLGGPAGNPIGWLRRGASNVYPGAMTEGERTFVSSLQGEALKTRAHLIGLTQTNKELQGTVDAIPEKGDIDATVIPKLKAARDRLIRERDKMRVILQGSNVRDPTGGGKRDPLGILP